MSQDRLDKNWIEKVPKEVIQWALKRIEELKAQKSSGSITSPISSSSALPLLPDKDQPQ